MYGFDNIFHTDIMKNLINNVKKSNIHHAYIFEGSEGLGKKNAAALFACAVICKNSSSAPCGICSGCIQARAGSSPDIKVISKGDKKSIGVDKIREEIIEDVIIKPFSSMYKVYIIEDAHLMTEGAQNAFLKVLEEPPSYTVFILTVSDSSLMLNTVYSRCVAVRFPPLSDSDMLEYIKNKYPDETRLDFLVKYSEGIPKNADDIISDPDFEFIRQKLADITSYLFSQSKYDAFKIAEFFEEYKSSAYAVFSLWQKIIRDIVIIQEDSDIIINSDMRESLSELALYTDEKKVIYAVSRLTLAMQMLKRYVNLRAVVLNLALSVKNYKC